MVEPKLIIYLIGGVLYFLYSVSKKAGEQKKRIENAPTSKEPPKPVSPPTTPFGEVVKEIKRAQAEAEARRRAVHKADAAAKKPEPKPKPKELFVHEQKPATFGQGAYDSPVYVHSLDEENVFKQEEDVRNSGVTNQVRPIGEVQVDETPSYEFDARQAIIGSIIFERKY